jgi:hypothetical protein
VEVVLELNSSGREGRQRSTLPKGKNYVTDRYCLPGLSYFAELDFEGKESLCQKNRTKTS